MQEYISDRSSVEVRLMNVGTVSVFEFLRDLAISNLKI